MKTFCVLLLATFLSVNLFAQKSDKLPFHQVPKAAEIYTAGSVASRMVDALGFRFYWATEGLTEKDLQYRPNKKVRSTEETVQHIYDLSNMLLNFTKIKVPQTKKKTEMTFSEFRAQTLINLQAISNRFKNSKNLGEFDVKKGDKIVVPFWNLINGPIADAIWHSGQIASFRRSSGNPINPNINHFSGTVKE